MVISSTQPNTPGAPVGEITATACASMPFGFTFALQSVRAGQWSKSIAGTPGLKETGLAQYNDTRRSRPGWGIHRV
ncbi:MAG TPA: hypothetical protein VJ183_10525 [Chloroflexia bacterium]|nr:hypothetical protein [Chloroflexia bacterium]